MQPASIVNPLHADSEKTPWSTNNHSERVSPDRSWYPTPSAFFQQRQRAFLTKLVSRPSFETSYVGWAVQKAISSGTPMGKCISHILNHSLTPESDIHSKVLQSTTTKRQTYCELNSSLQRHPMYRWILHFLLWIRLMGAG